MKKLLGILVLNLLLSTKAYSAMVMGSEKILILSNPSVTNCDLENNKGKWSITTPDIVKVKLSRKRLIITCKKDGYKITKEYLSLKKKDSILTKIADSDITEKDWVDDAIWDAVLSNPSSTIFNVVTTAGEFISSKIAKGVTLLYQPSTYAMQYRIVKKGKREKKIPLVIIELDK